MEHSKVEHTNSNIIPWQYVLLLSDKSFSGPFVSWPIYLPWIFLHVQFHRPEFLTFKTTSFNFFLPLRETFSPLFPFEFFRFKSMDSLFSLGKRIVFLVSCWGRCFFRWVISFVWRNVTSLVRIWSLRIVFFIFSDCMFHWDSTFMSFTLRLWIHILLDGDEGSLSVLSLLLTLHREVWVYVWEFVGKPLFFALIFDFCLLVCYLYFSLYHNLFFIFFFCFILYLKFNVLLIPSY